MNHRMLLSTLILAAVPALASADTLHYTTVPSEVNLISSELRADIPAPFRYGVAQDLAENILAAQENPIWAYYTGPESLQLSIQSVARAWNIDELSNGLDYVGLANIDPGTWIQSELAINPNATLSFNPSSLQFGDVLVADPPAVSTPEPAVWTLILIALAILGAIAGFKWLKRKPAPPVIMTEFGPTTEWARQQAAINMRLEPATKRAVEEMLATKYGGMEQGIAEARRRFPEAYED